MYTYEPWLSVIAINEYHVEYVYIKLGNQQSKTLCFDAKKSFLEFMSLLNLWPYKFKQAIIISLLSCNLVLSILFNI